MGPFDKSPECARGVLAFSFRTLRLCVSLGFWGFGVLGFWGFDVLEFRVWGFRVLGVLGFLEFRGFGV